MGKERAVVIVVLVIHPRSAEHGADNVAIAKVEVETQNGEIHQTKDSADMIIMKSLPGIRTMIPIGLVMNKTPFKSSSIVVYVQTLILTLCSLMKLMGKK